MNKKMITLVLTIMTAVTALTTVAGPCGGRGCPRPPCRPHHGYDWNHGGRQDFWMNFAGAAAGALVGGIINNATQPRQTVVVQEQPVQYVQQPVQQVVAQPQQYVAPQAQYVQPQVVAQQVAVNTTTTQMGGQVAYQQRTTRVWVPGHYEISQTGGYQTWIGGHYETVVVQ